MRTLPALMGVVAIIGGLGVSVLTWLAAWVGRYGPTLRNTT